MKMVTLIWICLLIDITLAIFLMSVSVSPNQDAAGKGMIFLPIFLLIFLAIIGYALLQKHHLGWALFVTGLPVIVLIYYLFISFT